MALRGGGGAEAQRGGTRVRSARCRPRCDQGAGTCVGVPPAWFFLPAAVVYGILFLLPTIASFWFSLTRWNLFEAEFIGPENFTLYNFQSQFSSEMNLLFMNVLLVTIPPLIVFVFFNRQIVAGMTAGAT